MREQPEQDPGEERKTASPWQWVALGVFVVCWLAEAAWCAAHAP